MAACRVSCSMPDQGNRVTTLPGLSPIFPGGSLTTKDPLTVPRCASRIDPEVSPLSFSPLYLRAVSGPVQQCCRPLSLRHPGSWLPGCLTVGLHLLICCLKRNYWNRSGARAEQAKNLVSGSGAVTGCEKIGWTRVAERRSGVTEIGLSG